MKKFFAIVLGLAMVLGFAAVASAEFKITGEFEAIGTYTDEWEGLSYDSAFIYVDLTGALADNVTAEIKFGFDFYEDPYYFFVNMASLTYNVTDNFYVGYQWSERNDGNPYRLYKASDFCFADTIGSIYFAGQDYVVDGEYGVVKAGVKFDGGEVTGYSDLYPDAMSFWAKGTYALDALSFTAWLQYDGNSEVTTIIGSVGYDITDELNVAGFIGSDDGELVVGARAEYAVEDLVTVKGRLEFAEDETVWGETEALYDYNVKATLMSMGNFQPYALYDDDDEFEIGFDYYFGEGDSEIFASYVSSTEEFTVGLYFCF